MTRRIPVVFALLAMQFCVALAAFSASVPNGHWLRSHLDACDSVLALTIRPEGNSVRLQWANIAGVDAWIITRATLADMSDAQSIASVSGTTSWLETNAVLQNTRLAFYRVIAHWNQGSPDNYRVIENFESMPVLQSYSPFDQQPSAWQMWNDDPYGSGTSLELYGDTWKREVIDRVALRQGSVWRIAMKSLRNTDNQAFGIADSANELWYSFWGHEIHNSEGWNNGYQGYFPTQEWEVVDLSVGDDWMGRFGYYPRISQLLFANDNNSPNDSSRVRFDEIRDVTDAVSLPPVARFRWSITAHPTPDSIDVTFCSMGCDPDGPLFGQLWSFGDGTMGRAANPVHRYASGHSYRACLSVQDTTGRADWIIQSVGDTAAGNTQTFSALFTGDVMMARRYEWDGGPGIIPTSGVTTIFSRVRPWIMAYDFAACNLECPLTTATTQHPTKDYCFKGIPSYVGGLTYAGFDFCSLANNHTFDYLETGMYQTEHALDSVNLLHGGSGRNEELAKQPVLFSKNGLSIAVVSFCNRDGTADNQQPYLAAGPSRPGFALWDRTGIEEVIPRVHQSADLVVAEVHSGIEYATAPPGLLMQNVNTEDEYTGTYALLPDTSDVALRHYAIDQGADVVINHHPHVIQGCEVYHSKLIAHSMGNFAFDQQFMETFYSMVITAEMSAQNGVNHFVVRPIYIDRYVPTPASGDLAQSILNYITTLSRPLRTWVIRASSTADTAIVVMDTLDVTRTPTTYTDNLTLEVRGGWAESAPTVMRGEGYPVSASVVTPVGTQIRVGREVFWLGNMENQGGSGQWNLNSVYEKFDSATVHTGRRSIYLTRGGGGTNSVSTNLIYRFPIFTTSEYSFAGWINTNNARDARMTIEFYAGRTGGDTVATQVAGTMVNGSVLWQRLWSDLAVPNNGYYCNIVLGLRSPTSGTGQAWIDDLELIRWDPWSTGTVNIDFPGDVRYVQVRAPSGFTTASISYRKDTISGLATNHF